MILLIIKHINLLKQLIEKGTKYNVEFKLYKNENNCLDI